MSSTKLKSGQIVYDPRGIVETEPKPLAPRLSSLKGLRLGVLNNSKWNSGTLLRKTVSLLEKNDSLSDVNFYKKESFSKIADPDLIDQITKENDAVITAIGD
jgi:hypothetical protein